jgi:hypothetical protein
MLAQAALAAEGLLNVLGAGWTEIGPEASPFAIAGIVEVPWTGSPHTMRFDLLDDQGQPVVVDTPHAGPQAIVIQGQFDVAPQPGVEEGAPIQMPIAINLGPQQLMPGARYEWRVAIDGESHEDWRIGFSIRPAVQPDQPDQPEPTEPTE